MENKEDEEDRNSEGILLLLAVILGLALLAFIALTTLSVFS